MGRNVSRSKFKEMKQEYRDEIGRLKAQLRQQQAKPAPAPKPVGITQEARDYRDQSESFLKQAESIRGGYSAQLASIAEREKIYEQTMASRSAALQKQQEEGLEALKIQGIEDRKIAASEAATRSANQRRSELAPSLQIQSAGEAPTTGGTQPFKRRQVQFNKAKPYDSLSIKSQSLNV